MNTLDDTSTLPIKTDEQKLALVTGASGPLGLATAGALIDGGYLVIMVDLDQCLNRFISIH